MTEGEQEKPADDGFAHPAFWHWVRAVDSMDAIVLLLEQNRTVIRTNAAITKWGLGKVTEAPGKDFHELLHPHCENPSCYLQDLWFRMTRYLAGKAHVEQEIHDDQLDRWVSLTIEPIQAPENQAFRREDPPFAMMTVRDTTSLRHQKEMEARKTRFEAFHFILRGLAHEIGNPLAAMRTTVEVLKESIDTFPPEKVETYLQRVVDGTERLQSIVDRTLRSQYLPRLQLIPFSLRQLLDRMKGLFEDELNALGIRFRVEMPLAKEETQLLIDLTAAEEVIVNLLKNAREACSAEDTIFLIPDINGERVILHIRDTGPGMDHDQLSSLFLPLFSNKPGGLGIGLAYSNYLMGKMEGQLRIESKPGKGTDVKLTFKRAKTSSETSN